MFDLRAVRNGLERVKTGAQLSRNGWNLRPMASGQNGIDRLAHRFVHLQFPRLQAFAFRVLLSALGFEIAGTLTQLNQCDLHLQLRPGATLNQDMIHEITRNRTNKASVIRGRFVWSQEILRKQENRSLLTNPWSAATCRSFTS